MTPLEKYCLLLPSEYKAMRWLESICKNQDWVKIHSSEHPDVEGKRAVIVIEMTIHSLSQRIYELTMGISIEKNRFVIVVEPTLRGKVNVGESYEQELSWHDHERLWCTLCLDVSYEHRKLPFCDQLVSMALGLRDDVSTARRLPMLDLFLAHDQTDHVWIEGYDLNGPERRGRGIDDEKLIPMDIRMLCHKFACMIEELQYSAFEDYDRYDIIGEEMRNEAVKIRRNKLSRLES
tara:strand:+ start:147 stop:851 length:705 start_codon:yes stop_codon:yes gene_type:complete